MKKQKMTLSRETIRQLTTTTLTRIAGGYAPEPSLACSDPCSGNCITNNCQPAPSDGCITQTCHTYNPECVVRF